MRPADNNDDERTFLERHGLAVGLVAAVLIGGAVAVFRSLSTHGGGPPPKIQEISMVKLLPPPPPPPLPPPPPQPPEEKMIEQTPIEQQESKPEDKPAPAPNVGTGIKGNGPADSFGLSGSGGNGMIGGGGNRGGSRWGWFAGEVQAKITDALRNNPRTRSANVNLQVRIWADAAGRITRVRLAGSIGDRAVEEAIRNQVLTGLQLPDAPPPGMPMPIVLHITERQPD